MFEEPSEPDVPYESEPEVQPEAKALAPKKRYASTKGDADKRKQQSIINLAKARQAKAEKAKLRKQAEAEASQDHEAKALARKQLKKRQVKIQDSSSEEEEESGSSSEEEIILTKRTKSKAIPIPRAKSKTKAKDRHIQDEDRMDRIESIMEKIVSAKRKKPKVVKNTIVQFPPGYGAPPTVPPADPTLAQMRRRIFADI